MGGVLAMELYEQELEAFQLMKNMKDTLATARMKVRWACLLARSKELRVLFIEDIVFWGKFFLSIEGGVLVTELYEQELEAFQLMKDMKDTLTTARKKVRWVCLIARSKELRVFFIEDIEWFEILNMSFFHHQES